MLYGKYAERRRPSPSDGDVLNRNKKVLFKSRDEAFAEYRKGVFEAFGKEYVPADQEDSGSK